MIPLTERVLEECAIPFLPLTDGGTLALPESIGDLAAPLAKQCKLAYIEAEFFGGVGTQASVTWDGRGVPSTPLIQPDAINEAMRFLGVVIGDHHDEFDALGLGKHRSTEDWEAVDILED